MGVAALGSVPLVADGTRVKRGMGGPVGAWPREGGGPGHGSRSSWGARTRACAVGRQQPEDDGVGSHTGEAGEEREGRENREGWPVGRPMEWVPPVNEGNREGERMAGGHRVADQCFQIGSKVFKLDLTQNQPSQPPKI
jgi:hypothetical protein